MQRIKWWINIYYMQTLIKSEEIGLKNRCSANQWMGRTVKNNGKSWSHLSFLTDSMIISTKQIEEYMSRRDAQFEQSSEVPNIRELSLNK